MDCGATKVVTHYTLICSANVKNRGYIRGPEFANLDNILFNYDDKHKLLKTIIIKLSDTSSLQGMINIFWYLIDKRERLLNPLICHVQILNLILVFVMLRSLQMKMRYIYVWLFEK